MDHRVIHPTKEQVRAYMAGRGRATRPPPAPAEIRRQLGWRLTPTDQDRALIEFCLLPSAFSHLAARITLDWFFAPLYLQVSAPSERDEQGTA